MVNKIFDLTKNYIPITDEIKSFFKNDIVFAYIPVNRDSLIEKLREIRDNDVISGYINIESFFTHIEDPTNLVDCVIKIEGELSNDGYFDSIYDANVERRIADISDFNDDFIDNVRNLKLSFIKKYLYTKDNIDLFLSANDVQISKSTYDEICTNFSRFNSSILRNNCSKFVQSCNSEELYKCYRAFLSKLNRIIKDYSNDFTSNIRKHNNRRKVINVVNPVVCDIYGTPQVKSYIEKQYPKIKVKSLLKKDFVSLIGGF